MRPARDKRVKWDTAASLAQAATYKASSDLGGHTIFRSTLILADKTATAMVVPPDVAQAASLGSSKRPPVRATINGYTYRSTIAVYGGVFYLGVSQAVRNHTGVAAGDVVEVDLQLDTEPRVVTVPPDFKRALDRDKAARKAFDGLSYSTRRGIVDPIEQAKTPETRQRRIDKAVSRLREGRS